MPEYTTIRVGRAGGVVTVTLDRPEAGNALDMAMARELTEAAIRCEEDRSVRAVVLTSAGRAFCVGGDLKAFAQQGDALPEHLEAVARQAHVAIACFAGMRAPVVAAVNGAAAGIGMSLVAACDLAVAADSARFTLAYTRVGLVADGGATYSLPRAVGLKRALGLALLNPTLTAAQALEWGLVNRVVPAEGLAEAARSWAEELASGPADALGEAKRLMRLGAAGALEVQMDLEARAMAEAARSRDAREGIAAFLEKRPPRFSRD